MPHSTHDDTAPVEVPQHPHNNEADTEETPVVSREQVAELRAPAGRQPSGRASSEIDMRTEIDVVQPSSDLTAAETPFPSGTPTPATPSNRMISSPVIGLAKPRKGGHSTLARFAERKFRLPTESEIRAAVEGTPTEPVPLVVRPDPEADSEPNDDLA